MITRGSIYWVDPGQAVRSRPAKRRPVLLVQAAAYTASALSTVIAVVVTSNTALAAMPGNVFLPSGASGLPRDSVADVTTLVTLDKVDLSEWVGQVPAYLLDEVDRGLRRVLDLWIPSGPR